MEELLHYVWKHKMFPLRPLTTTDGLAVEVIDTGLHNHDAGPDFFNSKIRIGDQIWIGNVECHLKSSDWYLHHHEEDSTYDNVILHVVCEADDDVATSTGRNIPQLVLPIPEKLKEDYEHLIQEDKYPRCFRIIPTLSKLVLHSWLAALQTERLERKTNDIVERVKQCNGSWEEAMFQTLARSFGFGINSDAFEIWSRQIPLNAVGHHRDDIFQIEAFFMGQAGLLDINATPRSHRKEAELDVYMHRLASEYKYLAHKFDLHPMDASQWRFLRLRPQNFPYIRLSQLAMLYYNNKANLSQLVECKDTKELAEALQTEATDYWKTHYTFGVESEKNDKRLSKTSLEVLMINAIIPALFAFGRYHKKEELVDRAIDMLEELKAENNNIIRLWQDCGLNVSNAGDSQALIQLKKEYCDKKRCLSCRIGYQYIKAHPVVDLLKEDISKK